ELALGVPDDPREHALGPARRGRGATHGGGVRVRDGDAGRAGRGGAAARSRRRSGAAARQADAAPGPAGGGPGGSRPHARDGGAPLRTAHTTPRLLEAAAVAAP